MEATQDINEKNPNSQGQGRGNKPIWRAMLLFLIPLILSNVLQSIGQLFGMIMEKEAHCSSYRLRRQIVCDTQ